VKLVDTNILLYVVNPAAHEHPRVLAWWEAAIRGDQPIGFAWIVLVGFLRISTNPRAFVRPLSPQQALDQIAAWLDLPVARIVQESDDHWRYVRELLEVTGTTGSLTTDAHLGALAITHGATMVSCDADFLRFRQVRWENPLVSP